MTICEKEQKTWRVWTVDTVLIFTVRWRSSLVQNSSHTCYLVSIIIILLVFHYETQWNSAYLLDRLIGWESAVFGIRCYLFRWYLSWSGWRNCPAYLSLLRTHRFYVQLRTFKNWHIYINHLCLWRRLGQLPRGWQKETYSYHHQLSQDQMVLDPFDLPYLSRQYFFIYYETKVIRIHVYKVGKVRLRLPLFFALHVISNTHTITDKRNKLFNGNT